MRLGGPVPRDVASPEAWIAALRERDYHAAICPLSPDADDATVAAYAQAARDANIVIAEVGAWSNPISPDQATRDAAIDHCIRSLALAERIGARCCVNIAGSRGTKWDGPHPDNLSEETFALIVATTQKIIDAVNPTRTYFTLEAMPYVFPDTPDSYLQLIEAIDRPSFAVHFDPVNWISSPQRYSNNGAFIRECMAKLGALTKSCHAKDVAMRPKAIVHLDEVRPGEGALDYATFLREINQLDPDTPLIMEHLPNDDEYHAAGAFIRSVAQREGIALDGSPTA